MVSEMMVALAAVVTNDGFGPHPAAVGAGCSDARADRWVGTP